MYAIHQMYLVGSNGLKFICNPISNGIYYTFVSKLSSCSARAQTQTIMVMFVE